MSRTLIGRFGAKERAPTQSATFQGGKGRDNGKFIKNDAPVSRDGRVEWLKPESDQFQVIDGDRPK